MQFRGHLASSRGDRLLPGLSRHSGPAGILFLVAAVSLIASASCIHFVSHYDSVSYEHMTSLKAFHLKFIDDFTEGDGKLWDHEGFLRKRDEGELRFREAVEYEKGKDKRDKTREEAFSILYEEFRDNCELLEDKGDLYSKAFADELKLELEANYCLAIRGEKIRTIE